MKITRVRTFRLYCPLLEPLGVAQGRRDSIETLLVQIITDDGVEGWGECAGLPVLVESVIADFYAPRLIGQDPMPIESIWNNLFRSAPGWARGGILLAALSGIDMALWDMKGKFYKESLSNLWGGRNRERVPCYATGLYFMDAPEAEIIPRLLDAAHKYIEGGFRALKAQIGRNLPFDAALIRALRASLPETPLFVDANNAYDLPEAITIGRVLEEEGFNWYEEPLSAEILEPFEVLSRAMTVPIVMGESGLNRWGFQSFFSAGGVSVAQPNLACCGGPTEALKIRAVASSRGLNVVPAISGTMFNIAAALHFLATDPRHPGRAEASVGLLEVDMPGENALRDSLFSVPVEQERGIARVPTAPGLGVTIDVDTMMFFCVGTTET